MSKSRLLLVVLSILLAIGIYLLPIKPLKVKEEEKENKEEQIDADKAFDAQAYFASKRSQLDSTIADSLTILESQLKEGDKKLVLEEIVNFCYRNKQPFLGVKFEIERIQLAQDADLLANIGDRLIRISFLEQTDPGAKLYFSNEAVKAYKKALELNPKDLDLKVRLASAYMDGTNQVMNGVTLLLEVLEDEPDNLDANLILGRYGIVSGQFEKALTRLNTVIRQDTSIAEAYLYRAEALNGLGRSEEAIADFEKCKALLDNPQLENEIDIFIKELKNK